MSVLIVGYRRSEEITKCIQHVKALKPEKIYIAMDGPKDHNANILCNDARIKAINSVDWQCKINTFFSPKNIGAGKFMIKALDWFFYNPKTVFIFTLAMLLSLKRRSRFYDYR